LQNGGGISAGNYFSMDKFVDRVHASVDQPGVLGPPWTDSGADRGGSGHGGALTGARPPAAPVRQSSPAGAQKGERSTRSSARASPKLGRCCGGQATVVQNREATALGEDTAQAWRDRKMSHPVLSQNRVLIVCMTQDHLFHTYGQKCSQITKCHNIGYNYYTNNVFTD
jgi:hypothetical protein